MTKTSNQNGEPKPSFVPPVVAGAASIIPGLGHILARSYRRGIVILISLLAIYYLIWDQMTSTARRDTEILDIIKKAFRLEPTLLLLVILTAILLIWIIIDAYRIAKYREVKAPLGVPFMIILVFFGIGWQIGDINLYKMITGLDDAAPALGRVLWPWERAIDYPATYNIAYADIQVPCTDDPPPAPIEPHETDPWISVNPTCGDLSEQGVTEGSRVVVTGGNYLPDVKGDVWWEDPIGDEFRQRQEGEYVTVLPDENGDFDVEIILPYRVLPPSATEPSYIYIVSVRQVATLGDAQPSEELILARNKMIETIFIGMMATLFGIVFAIPLSFIAARNLMSASAITMGIYYITRGFLNIVRAIEPLIWAIIFVIVVGLGPFAGILALTVHSIAALGKLYSESIESINPGPIEAIQATGANWVQVVIFAVIPQIIPPFVSFTIYRWDINIRMSTVIGFVGGGGIGFLLAQWIRLLDYRAAGIAVWFIAITVAILDYVSAEIRQRFV